MKDWGSLSKKQGFPSAVSRGDGENSSGPPFQKENSLREANMGLRMRLLHGDREKKMAPRVPWARKRDL